MEKPLRHTITPEARANGNNQQRENRGKYPTRWDVHSARRWRCYRYSKGHWASIHRDQSRGKPNYRLPPADGTCTKPWSESANFRCAQTRSGYVRCHDVRQNEKAQQHLQNTWQDSVKERTYVALVEGLVKNQRAPFLPGWRSMPNHLKCTQPLSKWRTTCSNALQNATSKPELLPTWS